MRNNSEDDERGDKYLLCVYYVPGTNQSALRVSLLLIL